MKETAIWIFGNDAREYLCNTTEGEAYISMHDDTTRILFGIDKNGSVVEFTRKDMMEDANAVFGALHRDGDTMFFDRITRKWVGRIAYITYYLFEFDGHSNTYMVITDNGKGLNKETTKFYDLTNGLVELFGTDIKLMGYTPTDGPSDDIMVLKKISRGYQKVIEFNEIK